MTGTQKEKTGGAKQIEDIIVQIEAAIDIAGSDEALSEWQREMQKVVGFLARATGELAKTALQQTSTIEAMAGAIKTIEQRNAG